MRPPGAPPTESLLETLMDQLARTIARLPDRRWTSSEMWRIASGLVELLPAATTSGNNKVTGKIILVMQRLHEVVMIGFFLELGEAKLVSTQATPSASFKRR